MNCGRYNSAEKKIADISSTAPHDALNTRVRSTTAGTKARPPRRRSASRNTASRARPPASRARITGLVSPAALTRSSVIRMAIAPADSSPTPA